MRIRRQLEVPRLVCVDLAQAEPAAVGDEPLVGGWTADVDGLADHVSGQIRGFDVLPRHGEAAVGVHRVVEKALLELR